jgi:hypothetical protein
VSPTAIHNDDSAPITIVVISNPIDSSSSVIA